MQTDLNADTRANFDGNIQQTQSQVSTVDQLYADGWIRQDGAQSAVQDFADAFQDLGISHDDNDWKTVEWIHRGTQSVRLSNRCYTQMLLRGTMLIQAYGARVDCGPVPSRISCSRSTQEMV